MSFIDYYKVLGINKAATQDEIKKAYRKLARKHHPDLNPNDKQAEQKFKELNEANEVLSNVENRKKYDEYGKDWKHADQFEQAKKQQGGRTYYGEQGRNQGRNQGSANDYSSFFESMFGQGNGRNTNQFKGQDFNAEVTLTLKDVFETHQRTFTVNGKNIRITIPAGVVNGQKIKIKGQGSPGYNNGPNGDLIILFNIENHSDFKLDNSNLFSDVKLDLYTSLLGGEIFVDTFTGKVKLTVKPETQNGTKVKLKGKGFPIYKKEGQFGDLYITYSIEIPTHLTEKEKELFTELQKLR